MDLPVAGGAFNYIYLTFGELTAWIVGANMVQSPALPSTQHGATAGLHVHLGRSFTMR